MAYNEETDLYEGYIYKIISDIDDKIYIGQTTVNINTRWSQHLYRAKYEKDPPYLYKAMQKYGIDHFDIVVVKIIECSSIDNLEKELNMLEIEYIKKYNTLVPNGYNLTIGGDNFGAYYKIPVDKYDLFGNKICSYESILEAAVDLAIERNTLTYNTNGIKKCCDGIYSKSNGYVWRYKDDPFNKFADNKYGNARSIKCFLPTGKFIGKYDSISEALKLLNITKGSSTAISACCMGKYKTAYGYVWRYLEDSFDKYSLDNARIKKDIVCYSLDNVFVKYYKNANDAVFDIWNEKNKTKSASIRETIRRNNGNVSNGYKWFYASDPNQPDKSKIIPV